MARNTGRTVAWVTGGRDAKTVRKLYQKLKHLKHAIFYTDDWESFAKVIPKKRHIIGKQHTVTIERDNSNTRHYLSRMTRRTKVVSKSETMVNLSLKLLFALNQDHIFQYYQDVFLSIF